MVPLGFLCTIANVLYALTSWSVFARLAVTLAKLDLKVYLLIRYIAATWLTEKELSEIESELERRVAAAAFLFFVERRQR